jgi:hypothetical protein
MSNAVHIVLLIAVIAFWVVPAVLSARLAERNARSFGAYPVAALLIGWPVPLVAALILPSSSRTV